jgi:uncharacterized protein
MLVELRGKNFGCFRDEFKLSLLAADLPTDSNRGVIEVPLKGHPSLRLLRCAAIYGANASGKSTVLRVPAAIWELMQTVTLASNGRLKSWDPFLLDQRVVQPSEVGLTFVSAGETYSVDFSFTDERVTRERLVQLVGDDEVVLFERVDQSVVGQWVEDRQFSLVLDGFRENVALLSLADRLLPKLAGNVSRGLFASIRVEFYHFENAEAIDLFERDRTFADWFRSQLRRVDVGVTDVKLMKASPPTRNRNQEIARNEPDAPPTLALSHRGANGDVVIQFERESVGTLQFTAFSPVFFDLLHESPAEAHFVDEIDTSLHPLLLEDIIRQINARKPTDPGGQLIFTTHDTALIDGNARNSALRRDQVYFTEKDAHGASTLYSLEDFKARAENNIRKRYLSGRYGGIPIIHSRGD